MSLAIAWRNPGEQRDAPQNDEPLIVPAPERFLSSRVRPFVERRTSPRLSPGEIGCLDVARLFPGRQISLLNMSSGGAMVETWYRLLPGSRVLIQFLGINPRIAVGAYIVRCSVREIDRERGLRYRGAVMFEQALQLAGMRIRSRVGGDEIAHTDQTSAPSIIVRSFPAVSGQAGHSH